MADGFRAWAMRTSRDSESHILFVRDELGRGTLRQGWGYQPDQDLRLVQRTLRDPAQGWAALNEDQKLTWGHWRMLGDASGQPDDAMGEGDFVLVPNMPQNGSFTLCRLAGPYGYAIAAGPGDFGHMRPVEVLTPGGVSNTHPDVSPELRRSLRCRSRLWWIGDHQASLEVILDRVRHGGAADLRQGSDHVARAKAQVAGQIRASLDGLATAIEGPLRKTLQSAEWEPVLREALLPLLRDVEVLHTGGPAEKGADLEIHVPNPFAPAEPWIIAVQVKDFVGEIGGDVAAQLEQAIQARTDAKGQGRLVAVVLASTGAAPSAALTAAMAGLSNQYGVPVSCVHGDSLMRVIARGLFARYRDLPLD